jgi:hypothetical protein
MTGWINRVTSSPHPEERPFGRVSKDEGPSVASWFETAQERLLTMRVRYQLTPIKSRLPTSTPLWRRMPWAIAAWK